MSKCGVEVEGWRTWGTTVTSDSSPVWFWKPGTGLRRRWKLVLLGTCLSTATAGIASYLQPKIFSATTYLLVSESKITDSNSSNASFAYYNPNFVYYELLRSYETFIDQFQLREPPYKLTPGQFKRRRLLQVKLSKNTRLLEIDVEFPDARLAAEIANYFAGNAVAFNEEMNARDTLRTREFLKQQMDQARESMETSAQNLLQFTRSAQLDEVRESVRNLLEERSRHESRLTQLSAAVLRVSAERDGLAVQLNKHEPRILLKRSLPPGSSVDQNASRAAEKSGGTPSPVLSEEAPNPIHQQVQSRLIAADAELLGLTAELQSVQKAAEAANQRLGRLLRDKAVKESTLEELNQDYQLARENYATLNKKYREASVDVSARSTDLKVIAPAIVPEIPVKPRVLLNLLVAWAFGFIVSSLLAIGLNRPDHSRIPHSVQTESAGDKITELKRSAKGFS
jgi:uncharacterized protein involved in exopolysaccharide biosynthesis